MYFLHAHEMFAQRPLEARGQKGDAFAHAFAVAHRDLCVAEVDIFDPQAQTFEESQAAPIEQLSHEAIVARQVGDDSVGLLPGQDDGDLGWAFYALDPAR